MTDQQDPDERQQDLEQSRREREQVERDHLELLARLRALDIIGDVLAEGAE